MSEAVRNALCLLSLDFNTPVGYNPPGRGKAGLEGSKPSNASRTEPGAPGLPMSERVTKRRLAEFETSNEMNFNDVSSPCQPCVPSGWEDAHLSSNRHTPSDVLRMFRCSTHTQRRDDRMLSDRTYGLAARSASVFFFASKGSTPLAAVGRVVTYRLARFLAAGTSHVDSMYGRTT
jgi:hypothetical protein